MLRYQVDRERNSFIKGNLLAEGIQLYREAIRVIPQEKYHWILNERYQNTFDLDGELTEKLCKEIELGLENHSTTPRAAVFLAQHYFDKNHYDAAIEILHQQREITENEALTWVKEAEFHAREGYFEQAGKCIDTAKRALSKDEDTHWQAMYWGLIVSLAREDFDTAKTELAYLSESHRGSLPKGYFWKSSAKSQPPPKRTFRNDARIWTGKVEDIRTEGGFGRITMQNSAGERLAIPFRPKHWSRSDFRRGDQVRFVITILSDGVRADDIDSAPFINTEIDIFVG
jgi:tetratricopeptide (TPR) repeat protein